MSLLLVWQLVTVAGDWVFFPAPSKILIRVYQNWFSAPASSFFLTPAFWTDVVPSVGRALAGLAIAIVIGVALGVVAGQWVSAAAYIDPPVNFMRSLPKPAIVPIFLLVLGASDGMRIGLIAFGCIWPILLNTMQGVRSVDPSYRETAIAFHIPTVVTFFRVILPAASPKIAAGVRVSLSLALILMVLSEWMLAMDGLGLLPDQRPAEVSGPRSVVVDRAPRPDRLRPQRGVHGGGTPTSSGGTVPPACRADPTVSRKESPWQFSTIHDLNKTYGTGPDAHIALSNVDLTVDEGQFVSIVGPSGCGKTTLMKCVAGLVKPTSGSVSVLGRPVAGVPDDLAVVFQDYSRSLFPWMRVAQNIEFPLRRRWV